MIRFSVLEHLFPVLEHPFPVLERLFSVLERLFPVLERPFPVFLFFWEGYFVPGRDRGVCPGTKGQWDKLKILPGEGTVWDSLSKTWDGMIF